MDADMCSRIKVGFELVPQLRRLILEIPLEVFVSRRKIPLLRSRPLLVSPDTNDHGLIVFFLDNGLEGVLLQQTAAFDARNPAVRESLTSVKRRAILPNDEFDPPLFREAISKGDHLRNLITRVDVHTWNRHMTEKSLSQQPKHHTGVFADAPEHRQPLKFTVGLP